MKRPYLLLSLIWVLFAALVAARSYPMFLSAGFDYQLYYIIGDLFRHGDPSTMYVARNGPYYAYSPIAAPLFGPLALLPFGKSRILFYWVKMLVFLTWPYLLALLAPARKKLDPRLLGAGVLASVLLTPTVFEDFIVGNLHVLFTTGLILLGYLLIRRKTWQAGVLLSAMAVFKPHFAIFGLPFLFEGVVAFGLGGLAVVAAVMGISLLFMSPSLIGHLTTTWLGIIKDPVAGPYDANNMAVIGLVSRWLTEAQLTQAGNLRSVHLLNLGTGWAVALSQAITALAFASGGVALFHLIKWRSNGNRALLSLSVLSLLMLTLVPVIWMTYLILLLFPVYFLCLQLVERPRPLLAGGLAATGVALFVPGFFLQNSEHWRVLFRAYAIPQLVALGILGYLALQVHASARKSVVSQAENPLRTVTSIG